MHPALADLAAYPADSIENKIEVLTGASAFLARIFAAGEPKRPRSEAINALCTQLAKDRSHFAKR